MRYKIDTNKYKISAKGSEEEIREFGKCLASVVNGDAQSRFNSFEYGETAKPFELDANHKISIRKDKISYTPEKAEDIQKETYFREMNRIYMRAKDIFEDKK